MGLSALIRTGSIAEVREWSADARGAGEIVALVPTMGYLHQGHLSLLRLARSRADRVALSIFVNPLQFGPSEDLATYPRDVENDLKMAAAEGVDLVFTPSVPEMYPMGEPWISVTPDKGADRLCGAARPGHFRGVLTVVAKLFGIVRADVAVFGQKDYQQLTLIRRMVADLNMPIEILGAPIVREPDGLAMSSRNSYLSDEERVVALRLSAALRRCETAFAQGERKAEAYRRILSDATDASLAIEYAEVIDPLSLEPVDPVEAGTVCALAGRVGKTRLIDNTILG